MPDRLRGFGLGLRGRGAGRVNRGAGALGRGAGGFGRGGFGRGGGLGRGGRVQRGNRGRGQGRGRGRGRGDGKRGGARGEQGRGQSDASKVALNDFERAYIERRAAKARGDPVPYKPEAISVETFRPALATGEAGVAKQIEDAMRDLGGRRIDQWVRPEVRAERLLAGEVMTFGSDEEKDAVVTAAQDIAQVRAEADAAAEDTVEEVAFSPVEENGRTALLETCVRGTYTPAKDESGVLGEVSRLTWKNGSYMPKDGELVVARVHAFMPRPAKGKAKGKRAVTR